ncbi:MAG: acyl-CoA desaturase [Bacteroidetes bacterium]|nr:acyl-CoA desaturase [Bacteroidota bacterium]
MAVFLILIFHWYLSLFFQTFFHHRYAAHSMFTMSRSWEKIFYVLSWLAQGSSYLSPYSYAVLHRWHHSFADTHKQSYEDVNDKTLINMMWRTKIIYSSIFSRKIEIEDRFKENLPEWFSFEMFANNWITRLSWAVFYVLLYVSFATEWWMFLFLPIHFFIAPLPGAIINLFAHKYGYTNFDLQDSSRNILPVDIFMLGEGYHNNHHRYNRRANFGVKWFEFDPVYPVIRLLDRVGIISLKRAPLTRTSDSLRKPVLHEGF